MFLWANSAALLLSAPAAHTAAHAAANAAAQASSGDVDRVFRFSDRGMMIGAAFLLALSFMFWVLWSFWREGRRERAGRGRRSLRL
ncbi:MAG TPA: hypothetical protein VGR47_19360 [Terracidiphilus sp.]|nr:hypothetical protein [Terracidiphilus sp.]